MENVIHLKARLQCNPTEAFRMFTVNEAVDSWLILPFDGDHAEIEPKIGGKYELFWDRKSRENNSTLGCKITAIEIGKFIAFEWKGPTEFRQFMNNADPLTHVVVFFIPSIEGAGTWTDVHLVHSGWGSSPEWQQARDYFEKAWNSAFEKLKAQINS